MKRESMNYAEKVKRFLNQLDLDFNIHEEDDDTAVFLFPMPAKTGSSFHIRLRIDRKGDSKFWCFLAHGVKEVKKNAMLQTLNTLNDQYRFLRFSLDKDNDICADYDFILFGDGKNAGEQVITLLMLMTEIMDTCTEAIMKTMWSRPVPETSEQNIKFNLFGTQEGDNEA
ncbi:MAG: YbjN domain-containing protein [Oscillospiraceae bacterium]|nr:YbjN domain-containing protein [Oscillospiraceae bacterium]